jgi:hypothetical protein
VPFNVNQGQPIGYTTDTIEHLNYFAGGAPHGIGGPAQPTELKRALELPAQWTSLLIAGDDYAGARDGEADTPVAYFETSPVNPSNTLTVNFDAAARARRTAAPTGSLTTWDFGDGTHATGRTVSHTFSGPVYADVKLAVGRAGPGGCTARRCRSTARAARLRPRPPAARSRRRSGGRSGPPAAANPGEERGGGAMKRLLLVLAVSMAAISVAVSSSASGAPAVKTQKAAAILATAEHPVIDNDFLYRELYFSSTDFIFRVGGADGPPSNPSNVNNLPKNYNGANEYYSWWKSELTNPDDAHMGPMGRFATAKDHFEPCCSGTGNQTYPFQLNDATVTVPARRAGPVGPDHATTTARRRAPAWPTARRAAAPHR